MIRHSPRGRRSSVRSNQNPKKRCGGKDDDEETDAIFCHPGKLLASAAVLSMAVVACGPSSAATTRSTTSRSSFPTRPAADRISRRAGFSPVWRRRSASISASSTRPAAAARSAFSRCTPRSRTATRSPTWWCRTSSSPRKGKDVGYKPADFAYIAMTETAPGALVVAEGQQVQDAEGPGRLRQGQSGQVDDRGHRKRRQGGTSPRSSMRSGSRRPTCRSPAASAQIVPYLQGNHVDAAEFASSHAAQARRHDQRAGHRRLRSPRRLCRTCRPSTRSATMASRMATTWGVMAPPGTPADIVQALNDAVEKAVSDPKVQAAQEATASRRCRRRLQQAKHSS